MPFDAKRYLQKFGWAGEGLGKKEDGIKTYVRVAVKDDSAGVGLKKETEQQTLADFANIFDQAANNLQIITTDGGVTLDRTAEAKASELVQEKVVKRAKFDLFLKGGTLLPDDDTSSEATTTKKQQDRLLGMSASSSLSALLLPTMATGQPKKGGAVVGVSVSKDSDSDSSDSDSDMQHMYHGRCKGKLARIAKQDAEDKARREEERVRKELEEKQKKKQKKKEKKEKKKQLAAAGNAQVNGAQPRATRKRDRLDASPSLTNSTTTNLTAGSVDPSTKKTKKTKKTKTKKDKKELPAEKEERRRKKRAKKAAAAAKAAEEAASQKKKKKKKKKRKI